MWKYSALAISLALTACAGSEPGPRASQYPPFSQAYLNPSTGRVGYHMALKLSVPYDNYPAGLDLAGCSPATSNGSLSGTLPPGLKNSLGQGDLVWIEGTPRQPGSWTVSVTFTAYCTKGPDQTPYTRQVHTQLNIAP